MADRVVPPATLIIEIDALIQSIAVDAQAMLAEWRVWDIAPGFQPCAQNLADYLALRRHDLRPLQRALMRLGLSSLGRLESRVVPALITVRAALAALNGEIWRAPVDDDTFFAGDARLAAAAEALFGTARRTRSAALMVTCPTEAADDPAFMQHLAARGVEALRINCAHDGPAQWERMIAHARAATLPGAPPMKVFMDLAGPKLRTGKIRAHHHARHVFTGDRIAIVAPDAIDCKVPADVRFTMTCTLPEAIAAAAPGQRLLIDDGHVAAMITAREGPMLLADVVRTRDKGIKLRPEKGINLPDTAMAIPALTAADRAALAFVAKHADGIGYSFVQNADDVAALQAELTRLRPHDWDRMALVLKIETARAVSELPEIIVRAAARQPVAVMIARGDLAIEIGFARLAEMQEEILWIAEAAQVPVIWATQVLEQLVKEGMPNRGELTDAAMGARAECVMLNKGPYLLEAIDWLDTLLGRMEHHLHKKTPQLRPLASWA